MPVRTVADIRRAKEEGRVGIILGFQNTTPFEENVRYVQLFKELGVGVAQITYNTQTVVGSGCYESTDSGLSDFGKEIVAEMNRCGVMCDVSHVGPVTTRDTILASTKPVVCTHCLPSALKKHPRNKSDDELRFIVNHGGFVGVTMFTPFLRRGADSTVDDYIEALEHIIGVVGDKCVGIGTDFTEGHGPEFFEHITHDKGKLYHRKLTNFDVGGRYAPHGFDKIADFPNVTKAMVRAGWDSGRIRRVLGENWLRVLGEVWG